jgi:hypothetical protein
LDDGFGYAVWDNPAKTKEKFELPELKERRALGQAAYEPLFNKAAQAQIAWRVEKGLIVDKTVYSIMDGAKAIDTTTFSTVQITPETQSTYTSNGGTE